MKEPDDLLHKIDRKCSQKLGILIYRSTLDHEKSYKYGGYLRKATIAGWGYSIYAIYWGWILNKEWHKGGGGYHNWCVYGYCRRTRDDLINIDQ